MRRLENQRQKDKEIQNARKSAIKHNDEIAQEATIKTHENKR